jgi:hypothetical protein
MFVGFTCYDVSLPRHMLQVHPINSKPAYVRDCAHACVRVRVPFRA